MIGPWLFMCCVDASDVVFGECPLSALFETCKLLCNNFVVMYLAFWAYS
jgi:hypothetical protein